MAAKSFREDPRRKLHEKLTQKPVPQQIKPVVKETPVTETKPKVFKRDEK
jgi:hypothetical protein